MLCTIETPDGPEICIGPETNIDTLEILELVLRMVVGATSFGISAEEMEEAMTRAIAHYYATED